MFKILIAGAWAILVALGASYAMVSMQSGAAAESASDPAQKAPMEGIESHKLDALTVPMIRDGKVDGYVLAKLAFTADAKGFASMTVDPVAFVTDEAFREIYSNGQIDFARMEKYDLDRLTASIKTSVNQRLGTELVHDVLVQELNYVDKASLKQANGG
jgi:flagellar basal body-associated protein FliL